MTAISEKAGPVREASTQKIHLSSIGFRAQGPAKERDLFLNFHGESNGK